MRYYEKLEESFSKWMGLAPKGMVACSSGTAALHLALESLNLPLGSRVLVPDYTMIACARAVSMAGLEPVFIDCDEDLLLDTSLIPIACDRIDNVKAIMPVHIYGRKCNMNAIMEYASELDLKVVEDRAEYHVPLYKDEKIGHALCWSFYANKVINGEEGGAVWLQENAEETRERRCLGFTSKHDYQHSPRGYNYRLADCLAEKILDSLDKVVSMVEHRITVAAMYDHFCPDRWRMPPRRSPWVYDLRIPTIDSTMQNNVIEVLKKMGFEARHGFKALHTQREYTDCETVSYPSGDPDGMESLRASREVILLPLGSISMSLGLASLCFNTISDTVGYTQKRFRPVTLNDCAKVV